MRYLFLVIFLILAQLGNAQSDATEALDEEYDPFKLFFYKSTLRMLNTTSTQEYYEMVKDIEKAKFLRITPEDGQDFSAAYKKYIQDLESEGYGALMTMRYEGNDLNILEKSKNGTSVGMVLVVNSKDSWIVLDILGQFDMQNAGKLIATIQSFDLQGFDFD